MNIVRATLLSLVAWALVACTGKSPGPLEGTWTAAEPFPVTVTFRSGEAEAMGRIRKVSYTVHGDEVLVTYSDGSSFPYTVIDADTIRSESGTFQRVR